MRLRFLVDAAHYAQVASLACPINHVQVAYHCFRMRGVPSKLID